MGAKDQYRAHARQTSQSQPPASRTGAQILRLLKDEDAQAGHHLVELDLCHAFGVSRTPVRGALKLLAAEGIIAARGGRGFVLAKMPAAPRKMKLRRR